METIRVSRAEMEKRIARFKSLKPIQATSDDQQGIPAAALEFLTTKKLWPLLGASGAAAAANNVPAVSCPPGLHVGMVECPPGDGPQLHAHRKTHETFFCMRGRFEISWNDDGGETTILEEFDMASIPPGVCRAFRNVGDDLGYLLVTIQSVDEVEDLHDVAYTHAVGAEVDRRFGPATRAALERAGMRFDAGAAPAADAAD